MTKQYSCYHICSGSKKTILSELREIFGDSSHPEMLLHHITEIFPKGKQRVKLPEPPEKVMVIGYLKTALVEAAVVEIDGNSTRPEGGTYHCTISIDREAGGKPVMVNTALREIGFARIRVPFEIDVIPALENVG